MSLADTEYSAGGVWVLVLVVAFFIAVSSMFVAYAVATSGTNNEKAPDAVIARSYVPRVATW